MLGLNILGARVRIECSDPEILAELKRDFSAFESGGEPADIELKLLLAPPSTTPISRSGLRWKDCRISNRGGKRNVAYGTQARTVYDLSGERGTIQAADPRLLRELAYLTILSRVGADLDQRGLHRVHALGFVLHGHGGLFLLPEGGGKTTLALELLRTLDGFELLSDDIPLINVDLSLHPFPLRIGLREAPGSELPPRSVRRFYRRRHGLKHLVDLGLYQKRIPKPAPARWIIIGSGPKDQRPHIQPCGRLRAARALFSNLVLGVGTPQILELMLPGPPYHRSMLQLSQLALSRARTALRLLQSAQRLQFQMGLSARDNAKALKDALS